MSIEKRQQLPAGWRWAKLGDVCEFLDYVRKPINDAERQGRIKSKAASELYPYYGANGQVGWIDDYLFDEPLILLAEDGGFFGSVDKPIAYAVSGKCWVNNHAHVLRPREGVNFNYCLFALAIRPDIGALVTGNTRPKLNQAIAASVPVLLPPLPEQKRIAEVLAEKMASIEKARIAAEARLKAAKELPAAYLREVFESEDAQRWPTVVLGDAGEVVSGVTLGRKLNGAKVREVPYLRVANVKDGHLDLDDVKTIEVTESEIQRWILQAGDLPLTEGGDPDKLGRGSFWSEEIPECIHQNHIFRVRFSQDEFLPEFLSAQMSSGYGKAYFLAHAKQTTGIATINQQVLKAFPLLAPSIKVQRQLADTITSNIVAANQLSSMLAEEISAIKSMTVALLRQAFSG